MPVICTKAVCVFGTYYATISNSRAVSGLQTNFQTGFFSETVEVRTSTLA